MSILKQIVKYSVQALLVLVIIYPYKYSRAQEKRVQFNRVEGTNGISLGKITAIAQDPQGFMWFADQNNAAIIRYDGYKMVTYRNDPFNDNSLGRAYPETLLADSTGIIWIGLLGMGLDRFDPVTDSFTHYRYHPDNPRSLSNDTVNALLIDHEGILWVGTKNGLNRFDKKTGMFTRYSHNPNDGTSLSDEHVRVIYEDRMGTIWVGTGFAWDNDNEGGLNCYDRKTGTFKRFMHDPKNPNTLIDNKVRAIFEDSSGNFWVGTRKNGLHKMERNTGVFKLYPHHPAASGGLSSPAFKTDNKFDHISFITQDAEGALWIGTIYSGINRYDTLTKRMENIGGDQAGGFTDSSGWYAYTSRDGMLWLSTQENHLFRINPAHIDIPLHVGQVVPNCFYEESGILWIGTPFGLVAKDRKTLENIQRFVNDPLNPSSLSDDRVTSIVKGPGGLLWLGTQAGGLNRFDPIKKTFTTYRHDPKNENTISSNSILKLVDGQNGTLWIGTWKDGLDHMDANTGLFKNYKNIPNDTTSLSQNIISAIYQDKKNRLWVGTGSEGLNLLQPASGSFRHYLHRLKILCIYEDSEGIIWVGTGDNLFRFDESRNSFIRFTDAQSGLPFISVISILEDDSNNLWLSAAEGFIRLNKNRDHSITYDKNRGVHEGNIYIDAAYKGSLNELFFRDVSGYYLFSPDKLATDLKIPQLTLTEFRIGGKLVKPGPGSPYQGALIDVEEMVLTHRQNSFSIGFAAIDFRNPESNIHLFMLEGYDAEWRSTATEHIANYYNVPPDNYIFRLKVTGTDGIWIEKSIRISITPPWWTNWWFRAITILCLIALFYFVIRWRLQQKFNLQLERSTKEKQLAEIRQEKAELQQHAIDLQMQALRAQMNPHFIFNSLNSINRFILQNNKVQASDYLSKFSKLVRMILQNSQASLISLESEFEALQLYLELEALRFEQHFAYNISIPEDLDIDILRVPPLIIQPYVENAIWHGLMHKNERGQIIIEVSQERGNILIKIKDDGIGRKQARELASKSTMKHKSLGLKITADRIAMVNTINGSSPVVTINDLVHTDGSAAGTEVVITLPVINA